MTQIIASILLLMCLTQIHWATASKISASRKEVDCSVYADDEVVIHSFPFPIHVNPAIERASMTYAEVNRTHGVISLHIVDQKCIPSLIYCFKSLSKLVIVNTGFYQCEGELPVDIQRFASSLTELSITNTKVLHLPNGIGQLKRLEKLRLDNIGLESLPDSIGQLTSLAFLFVISNNLSSLPNTMTHLRGLHQLVLVKNPNLRFIDSLNGHHTLRMLDTRESPIELLPQNLPQLRFLAMSDNKLRHLTGIESLGKKSNEKKSFDFHGNAIQVLTPRICHVPNLYHLNLARNKLHVLPEEMFQIPTLMELNISNNHFRRGVLQQYISMFNKTNPALKLVYGD